MFFDFSIDIKQNDNYFTAEPDTFAHINSNNAILEFDYYSTHDFHKLVTKSINENCSSIFHINICSLNSNFENLELLVTNLDYQFTVIALTETWNCHNKKYTFNPGCLHGYQSFDGLCGTTLKSGCGFYIKNNIKYILMVQMSFK